MSEKTVNDWSNYWQGRAASESGAALVGVGVETDAEIAAFWTERFSDLPKTARLLDLACGAGSVVRRANAMGLSDLTGVDISAYAIRTLKTEFPNAVGFVASADETGLESQSFDVVASQFGFEYAHAPKAAAEAARLLAKGGQFLALAHSSDSAIKAEVSCLGGDARALIDSGFISTAREMFIAEMTGASDEVLARAVKAFSLPQAQVLAIAKRAGGLAAHLYQGTQTLYQKRRAYAVLDITGWLDGMEAEISAFLGRMDSMQNAALSQQQAQAVLTALTEGGLTAQPLEKFISKTSGDTIAWIICATNKA